MVAINLREEDELIEVKATDENSEIFLVTKQGMCIRFKETDVRNTGRSSMGVIGMNLSDQDEVVGMQLQSQGECLLIVSENGMGKRTHLEEFNVQYRGGKGIKCYKITEKTGDVIGVKAVRDDNEIMMITTAGIIIQLRMEDISILGRNTSGVKLINLEKNNKVARIAKVREKISNGDHEFSDVDEAIGEISEEEGYPMIVEDDEDFAFLIRKELEKQDDIIVAGICAESAGAVETACAVKPDVVLMDLFLGKSTMEGITASREIRVQTDAKVLIFTAHDENEVVEEAATQAYASGYILKNQIPLLVENIYALMNGGTGQEKVLLHMALSALTDAEKTVFWELMGKPSGVRVTKKTRATASNFTAIFLRAL